MKYMLDTNICIYIIKEKPIQILERFRTFSISDIGISSITLCELEFGVEKSQRKQQNRIALTQFLTPLEIEVFDESAAQTYGKIRNYLERNGLSIGYFDTLIAVHALSLEVVLVTNNEKEFSRVPGLTIDNWVQ